MAVSSSHIFQNIGISLWLVFPFLRAPIFKLVWIFPSFVSLSIRPLSYFPSSTEAILHFIPSTVFHFRSSLHLQLYSVFLPWPQKFKSKVTWTSKSCSIPLFAKKRSCFPSSPSFHLHPPSFSTANSRNTTVRCSNLDNICKFELFRCISCHFSLLYRQLLARAMFKKSPTLLENQF